MRNPEAPAKRITLQYEAPIYVTVNIETGDVERVYMDDEAVTFNEEADVFCVDEDREQWMWRETREAKHARQIADTADWTSTEGRCQVWRGAWGGPTDIVDIFRVGLELSLAMHGTHYSTHGKDKQFTAGDLRAALQFLNDSDAWDKEHNFA